MSAFERAWDAFRGVVDDVELDRLLKDVEREHAHELAEKIRTELAEKVSERLAGGIWEIRAISTAQQAADLIDPEVSR